MRAIDRKVLRDLNSLRGQLFAIGMVIATGVSLFLTMRICLRSLETAQLDYYAQERFGHVFCSLVRAPEHVAERLREIPGVHAVQTRVVAAVTLDVPGMVEAVQGRLVSLPDHGAPTVNAVRLRSGRWPEQGHGDEVVVSETFATAHGFAMGTRIGAIIDGKHEDLRIVGTAMSPEFAYTIGPGMVFPDDRRFGVLWMRRATLGPAFDMEGAFNDVSLRLARNARIDRVLARVDDVLDRYGSQGAIPRKDQPSHFFLSSELEQLRSVGMMIPILFLLAGAFLLNVVVGRIIAGQREQIAALKALGYHDAEIGRHFAKLVGIVVAGGLLVGSIIAAWLSDWMIHMYGIYYHLPDLVFDVGAAEVVQAVGITVGAAALGTWAGIRRTVRLPPAEAMRPEPPALYRRTVLERLGLAHLVPAAVAMVWREMERRPVRRLLTFAGMAMATALVVISTFFIDAIDHAMMAAFGLERREDVQLTLSRPRATPTLVELEHLAGVRHAEPFRVVPVRFRNGARSRNAAITGMPTDATLQQVLDVDLRTIPIPPDGIVVARKLAEILDVRTGDRLRFEVLEGHRRQHEVRVARVAETYIGLSAYMSLAALCRVLQEPPTLNGAWLAVDGDRLAELHRQVKQTPVIAGISSRNAAMRTYRELIDEHLGTTITINVSMSLIMALGILYNAARITLAEQAHQLASLRVLGFRRREVAAILLGELGILTVLAIPCGLWLGYQLAHFIAVGVSSEQLRIPLVVASRTYAIAGLTVFVAAALSGFAAWRRLDRMDIIHVLKTRE